LSGCRREGRKAGARQQQYTPPSFPALTPSAPSLTFETLSMAKQSQQRHLTASRPYYSAPPSRVATHSPTPNRVGAHAHPSQRVTSEQARHRTVHYLESFACHIGQRRPHVIRGTTHPCATNTSGPRRHGIRMAPARRRRSCSFYLDTTTAPSPPLPPSTGVPSGLRLQRRGGGALGKRLVSLRALQRSRSATAAAAAA